MADHLVPFLDNDSPVKNLLNVNAGASLNRSGTMSVSGNDTISFHPIRTIPVTIVHLLAVVFVEVQLYFNWFKNDFRFVMMPALLFLFFGFTYWIIRFEHRRMRSAGYLNRLISSLIYARLPLFVSALGSVISSIVFVYLIAEHNVYDDELLSPSVLLRLLLSFEHGIIIAVLLYYLYGCYRHNSEEILPDIVQKDFTASAQEALPKSLLLPSILEERGSPSSSQSSLIRRQAKIITYLQDQVKTLSQELVRVLNVNEADDLDDLYQRRSRPVSIATSDYGLVGAGSLTNGVADLEHMLTSKDQELRALMADRERIRTEAAMTLERLELMRQNMDRIQTDYDSANLKISEMSKELEAANRKQQKMSLLLEVEQEANSHAQETLQKLRDSHYRNNGSPNIRSMPNSFSAPNPFLQENRNS